MGSTSSGKANSTIVQTPTSGGQSLGRTRTGGQSLGEKRNAGPGMHDRSGKRDPESSDRLESSGCLGNSVRLESSDCLGNSDRLESSGCRESSDQPENSDHHGNCGH
jgi:hypothetical protein